MRKVIAFPFGVLMAIPYGIWLCIRFGLYDATKILEEQIVILKPYKQKHN